MATPLVTFLMPAYNAAATIIDSLASIGNCGIDDFGVVVVDDGSTDGTGDKVASCDLGYPIRLVRLAANMGSAAALNIGLTQISSRYVARLDADDLCENERVKHQLSELQRNMDVAFCGSQKRFFGSQDGTWTYPVTRTHCRLTLPLYCCYAAASVLFDRERVGSSLHFNLQSDVAEDYELYARLYLEGKHGTNIDVVGLAYRKSDNQQTTSKSERFVVHDFIIKSRLFGHLLKASPTMPQFVCALTMSYFDCARRLAGFNDAMRHIVETAEPAPHARELWPHIQNRVLSTLRLPERPAGQQATPDECVRHIIKSLGAAARVH